MQAGMGGLGMRSAVLGNLRLGQSTSTGTDKVN